MVEWSGLRAVHVELALVLLIEVLLVSLLLMPLLIEVPLLLIAGLGVVDKDDKRAVKVMIADAELDDIDVASITVDLNEVLLMSLLLISLLIEVSLLLIAGLDVVDADDKRVVEMMTADAELDDTDAASAIVCSVEVLLGLAFEDNESDDEGMPLAEDNAIEALEILNDILDGSALDGEEALLDDSVPNDEEALSENVGPVGRVASLDLVRKIVDVLIALEGKEKVEDATSESVSVPVATFEVLLGCGSLVCCIWVVGSILGRVEWFSVNVLVLSLLMSVDGFSADEGVVGIVTIV